MRGGRHKIGVLDRARMQSCHDQPCDVGDVRQQQCTTLPGDGTQPGKIDLSGIGACAHGDHLRPMFHSQGCQMIVVDSFVVLADAVMDNFKEPS